MFGLWTEQHNFIPVLLFNIYTILSIFWIDKVDLSSQIFIILYQIIYVDAQRKIVTIRDFTIECKQSKL